MALIPRRLSKGDAIGIVSPSSPVTGELALQLKKGVEFLERLGFNGIAGRHVNSTSWGYAASPWEKALVQMEDVLLRVTAEYDFPVLKTDDFGHNCPNTVLPVGCEVRIDADRRTIEILEKCVQ
jgi:muramoyltetrapeptide carboxypeptidase LdcA involved in peptidoglycan recycling